MQFTGTIIHKTEKITIGTNETPKVSLVLEETSESQYKDSVMIDWIGDEKVALITPLKVGDTITVHFNLRANEYNGKYYNNLNGWRIENDGGNSDGGSSSSSSKPASKKSEPIEEDFDDLPF